MVLEQTAVAIPLRERRQGIRVAVISDPTLLERATFVLAVSADMPVEEIRRRLPAQIKIGPVEQIRTLVNSQLPGVAVRSLPVAPRQISFHADNVYFELDRTGEMWKSIRGSGGMAVHLAGTYPGLKMELWAIRS
jgi:type VI secretion system protein ImpJ